MHGPFHPGEIELQRRAGVADEARDVGRIIGRRLPAGAARFLEGQPFAVVSSVEAGGRVWASPLAGPPGFIRVVDPQMLLLAARPSPGDPLAGNLLERPEAGLLVFDPRTRRRFRCNGRGLLAPEGIFLLVEQAYGNCPKYIARRALVEDAVRGEPGPPRVTEALTPAQQDWIRGSDTFFIASLHPGAGADASHRGGPRGFVRVSGDRHLFFPDFPGNGMFNTLGNLLVHPPAGLLFVDFASGGLLQIAGRARVGDGVPAGVDFEVDTVRETPAGSPLRWRLLETWVPMPLPSHPAPAGISNTEPAHGRPRSEE